MKYYQRLLHKKLISPLSQNKIRLIFGARQVGKTILLQHILAELIEGNSISYNLQDASIRRRLERDPAIFTRELQALPAKITHVFVDEIQKIPALLEEIQFLYDRDKLRWQFFLTGSSARKLRGHSANLLPGRSHVYHLYPVSLNEEKDRASLVNGAKITGGEPFPAKSLAEKLIFGNLPGIREETPESAHATLSAYVDNYVEEEIRKEALVRNTASFSIFLQLAALESGKPVNLSKLSQESGMKVTTIKRYYQVLCDTFLGYWMRSYKKSSRKRLVTTPRFYFFDLGVRNAAAELRLDESLLNAVGGPLLEHLVGLELIQRSGYAGRGFRVSFWRATSGAEVDFIFETPEEDIPIEVKWTDAPTIRDARHIETFMKLYPDRVSKGYVVCRVPRAQQLSEKVLAIPFENL